MVAVEHEARADEADGEVVGEDRFVEKLFCFHVFQLFHISLKDAEGESLLGVRITDDMSPSTQERIKAFRQERKRSLSRNWHSKFESKGVSRLHYLDLLFVGENMGDQIMQEQKEIHGKSKTDLSGCSQKPS